MASPAKQLLSVSAALDIVPEYIIEYAASDSNG